MQSMVLSRESISSVYALVIPVRPLFATSSFATVPVSTQDSDYSSPLRRACGGSCIRLEKMLKFNPHTTEWNTCTDTHTVSLFYSPTHAINCWDAMKGYWNW